MNRRSSLLLFGILALVVVIALVAAADTEGERGTRAGETYVGIEDGNCDMCHGTTHTNWTGTLHGTDFTNWPRSGGYVNKFTYRSADPANGTIGGCAECHVVGYNETGIGGFDPALPFNETNNIKLLGIQCEACHGPASAHIAESSKTAATMNIDANPYSESCGGTEFQGCHGGERQYGSATVPGWSSSIHSLVDDDPLTDDHEAESRNSYCSRCKDPSNFDPASSRNDNYVIPNEDVQGISCADCHNPHNDTGYYAQLKWEPEEVCAVCHEGGRHGTIRDEELGRSPSLAREDYPYMEEVTCIECHMFSTGHGTPEEFVVQGHTFFPTIEACVSCHSSIYDEMPDEDYPSANWTAWEADFDEVMEEWEGVVIAAQDRYGALEAEVALLLAEVEALQEVAEANGTWTPEIDAMYEQASDDYDLPFHASRGAHNPAYGAALFNAAKANLTAILEELSEGTLKGTVTDNSAAPLADVFISINGHGTKTGTDGTYTVMLEPGTYTVTAFKVGTIDDSASVTLVAAAVVEQNFTLAADFDGDGTPDSTDTDDDNDGITDVWETANGLDPMDPSDASADPDGDGKTNLQEYTDGTDPQVADKEEAEEADTTLYLAAIIVLIIILVLLGMMLAKKGGGKPTLPPEEPQKEPQIEESESPEEGKGEE